MNHFEMAHRAIRMLAIRILDEKNKNLEHPRDWPAGQKWHQLAGSSKAAFMAMARKECGIPDDEYLVELRSGRYDDYLSGLDQEEEYLLERDRRDRFSRKT